MSSVYQSSAPAESLRIINRKPSRVSSLLMAALPIVLLMIAYALGSEARLAENPNDKLLPGLGKMAEAMQRLAFEPNVRSGEYLFWNDTAASLTRLGIGIGVSALLGLVFGMLNGMVPWFAAAGSTFVRILSMVPPLALLPILFIVFGLGEISKSVLIIFGTAPFIMRDLEQRVLELPDEQLIKAQTLDATSWQIAIRVVLPQVLPRLIDAVRLSLGAGWLFLIAAEAIASTEGLGYRIFLVRRYLAMDVILPYVIWITLLAFLFDYLLRLVNRRLFPWY